MRNESFVGAKPVDAIGQKLLEAAQIVRERGWCQHRLCDEAGRVCLIGAIFAANPRVNDLPIIFDRVKSRIPARDQDLSGGIIVKWNNAVGRTAAEVIAVLESAAIASAGE